MTLDLISSVFNRSGRDGPARLWPNALLTLQNRVDPIRIKCVDYRTAMSRPTDFGDVPSPIGTFRVLYHRRRVSRVGLLERWVSGTNPPSGAVRRSPPFEPGTPPRQLQEYFAGKRTEFDLEPDYRSGSDFDTTVWKELCSVAFGQTVTYGELARRAGFPTAVRAVGGAMGRNSVPLIVPCHRVVGAGGNIAGFGLRIWRKRWLLEHENAWPLRTRYRRPCTNHVRDRGEDWTELR